MRKQYKELKAAWYQKNKEWCRIQNRSWRNKNRDYYKIMYTNYNKTESRRIDARIRGRISRQDPKVKLYHAIYTKKYRKTDKGKQVMKRDNMKRRDKKRLWAINNKDKVNHATKMYNIRKKIFNWGKKRL